MAKLEIPVVVDIDAVADLIEELKDLQTYKLSESDNMILVDRDDVVEIFVRHVKAKQREPERKTGRWIPCSERLPEHGGRYLISVLDGINRRTTVAPYLPRCKAWAMNGRMAYWKVIAWMLLPEPYKEEEQDG